MQPPKLAAILLLGAAACATSGAAAPSPVKVPGTVSLYQLPDGKIVRCELEAVTGSNFREMVCHPAQDKLLADKDQYRQIFSKPQTQLQQ